MYLRNSFIGLIFLLAVIGLGSLLFKDPTSLIKQLVLAIFIIAAIVFVSRMWIGNHSTGKEQRSFLKAARKSKRRLKRRHTNAKTVTARKKPIRKKSEVQLTVIEGKKGKKKNRAIF